MTLNTLEKIKAFAIGLVGAGIFSMGSTYFSEQTTYRIPRLLLPVYGIFGNKGLAFGMPILGVALMYFAFSKFVKNYGKSKIFITYQVITIICFYGIIYFANKKLNSEELERHFQKNEIENQNKIENTERPKIDNILANTYLDKSELLLSKFQKAKAENNKAIFDESEKEYNDLTTEDFGMVISEIGRTKKYAEFATYNAKIGLKIQEIRVYFSNRK